MHLLSYEEICHLLPSLPSPSLHLCSSQVSEQFNPHPKKYKFIINNLK